MTNEPLQSTMKPVLVIDDDRELCSLLTEFLEPEGYAVTPAYDAYHGLDLALSGTFCLVILDVMLPGMTGFELLQTVRKTSDVPVLMLTARGEEDDRITGLETGADDYLPKPFNPRELVARIHAIVRRTSTENFHPPEENPFLQVDDITLDQHSRVVHQDGRNIKLTAAEFSLLAEFLRHAGQVLTREELTRKVLGRPLESFDRSIDVHVSNLRRKLGHKIGQRERIRTIRSVGYLYTRDQETM